MQSPLLEGRSYDTDRPKHPPGIHLLTCTLAGPPEGDASKLRTRLRLLEDDADHLRDRLRLIEREMANLREDFHDAGIPLTTPAAS